MTLKITVTGPVNEVIRGLYKIGTVIDLAPGAIDVQGEVVHISGSADLDEGDRNSCRAARTPSSTLESGQPGR